MILGLVTTGQGPRPEFEAYNLSILAGLGVSDIEIKSTHILDGFSSAEIDRLAPSSDEEALHCNVHGRGDAVHRLGQGWEERWISLARSSALIQACLDDLNELHGAATTIYCCAEDCERLHLRSRAPLVLPWDAMLRHVDAVQRSDAVPTVGVMVRGPRQLSQQRAAFERRGLAARVSIVFEMVGESAEAAATRLAAKRPSLVLYLGYGAGLAPGDATGAIRALEAMVGAPVITPHFAAATLAAAFLHPAQGR